MKEYIPTGTCIREVYRCSTYEQAAENLETLKEKYPTAFIDNCIVTSSHTNRDGQYSESSYVVMTIMAEFPTYSREDRIAMTLDKFKTSVEKHGGAWQESIKRLGVTLKDK